jgi:hypothetical protein
MALFPPGKGGGEGVAHGGKGKGILIHSLTEGGGMPLANRTTPAHEDERAQVVPLLDAVKVHTGKRGRPRKRLKVIATDKGYEQHQRSSRQNCALAGQLAARIAALYAEHFVSNFPGAASMPQPARIRFPRDVGPHFIQLGTEATTHLQLIRPPEFYLHLFGTQDCQHGMMHQL